MKWRYRFGLFFFIFVFLLIDIRLYYWQIVRADELAAMGNAQYGTEVKLLPHRGQIMTQDGFTVAANKVSYLVFANPKVVKDKEKTADILSPLLKIDSATISAQLDRDSFYSSLKNRIDEKTKKKIESLDIDGIHFNEQTTRFYPEASMASTILGFVGKDKDGNPRGSYGLEGYYERELRGKEGISVQIRDAWGNPITAKLNDGTNSIDGRSLVLNVDRVIQYVLEEELKIGIEKYGAESGYAGILDPKTGAILGMAAFPTYDPRSYQDFKDNLYKNPFISSTYEPGSTFKTLVMSAGIDAGVVDSDTVCTVCDGPVEIGGYSIKTWNNKYYDNITMTEVIQHSDNTGMVFVGEKLGLDRMMSYFSKFGIGELTGIDLQGEVSPELRPKDGWYPIDVATATFGQGITVTPIELLSAFASIANDGERMEPHVVNAIKTPEGEEIKIQPKLVDKPISAQTARVMTEILVNAVDNGEAQWAKPKGYRIAGKTGTAQIPVAGHYDPRHTIASFIGFAPADDPKFAMLVVLNRPTSSIYGAETAAPIFFNIAKKVLTYYSISPDSSVGDM